ncbi:MAG TPA: aldo/keto reductase, partial [Anaerolineales bacterium]
GVLETARELGVTIVAYTPLERGLLSGKYHKHPELLSQVPRWRRVGMQNDFERSRTLVAAMEEIAPKYQATIAQVALNWLINYNGETVVTIPGATKVSQAVEDAGAMKFRLSGDDLARLDELSPRL